MSFVVHVALLSGRQMSLTVLTDTVVQDEKVASDMMKSKDFEMWLVTLQ